MPRYGSNGSKRRMLSKERYLEMKYKALQYPCWKQLLESNYDSSKAITYSDMPKAPQVSGDVTADTAIKCKELSDNIDKVERAVRIATDSCPDMYRYVLTNVTTGATIQMMENAWGMMPLGRNKFYSMRADVLFNMHTYFP